MAKLDRKKFREETVKHQQYRVDQDEFENFEGNIFELYLLKFSRYVSRNRKPFFIGIGIFIILLLIFIGYGEYSRYTNATATVELEKLDKKHENPQIDLAQKIKDYEIFEAKYGRTDSNKRASKILADFYARNGEFAKAALTLEKVATKIDNPKEVKALYFFIAGNYRELAGKEGDIKQSIQNYSIASSLLKNNDETAAFRAWSLYNQGRLKISNNQKEDGLKDLKSVVELESKSNPSTLEEVKELSLYLILKSSSNTPPQEKTQ
ncbi:MAG: hypothetical protein H7A23_02500 [Leptospiraceae bacterium]|nr:hypothetical protein [Leptospiraceae bacterium]MCP5493402.1 hypothetical protein [Leptospiraceae bacterium]